MYSAWHKSVLARYKQPNKIGVEESNVPGIFLHHCGCGGDSPSWLSLLQKRGGFSRCIELVPGPFGDYAELCGEA